MIYPGRIYLAHAQMYRSTDPGKAAELLPKAEAVDRREMSEQFCSNMMKSMGSVRSAARFSDLNRISHQPLKT